MSNTSSTSSTSSANSTSISGSPSGSDGTFPDRTDFPFVSEGDPLNPVYKLQPNGPYMPLAGVLLDPAKKFAQRDWSSNWISWRVLIEFSKTPLNDAPQVFDKAQKDKDANYLGVFGAWPKNLDDLKTEIATLVRYAEDERADALGEILAQDAGFVPEFHNLLAITPTGYPATCKALAAAGMVCGFVVIHFKSVFERPRPSQLAPALRPPLPPPGHASFPSGHAMQSWMMAMVGSEVCGFGPDGQKGSIASALFALAHRIARNREIAGLHYPSDSAAGQELAKCMYPLLRGTKLFDEILAHPVFWGADREPLIGTR